MVSSLDALSLLKNEKIGVDSQESDAIILSFLCLVSANWLVLIASPLPPRFLVAEEEAYCLVVKFSYWQLSWESHFVLHHFYKEELYVLILEHLSKYKVWIHNSIIYIKIVAKREFMVGEGDSQRMTSSIRELLFPKTYRDVKRLVLGTSNFEQKLKVIQLL